MLTLAIDSSSRDVTVALLDGTALLQELETDPKVRSAVSLIPAIRDLLDAHRLNVRSVQRIAVASGPGSFTGLRVGVVAAKSLAWASSCELFGVSTLTAIASAAIEAGLVPKDCEVCVVMNAHRGQLFAARFSNRGAPVRSGEMDIINADELAGWSSGNPVCGPGLNRVSQSILDETAVLAPSFWQCRASWIGKAVHLADIESSPDAFSLVPAYGRPSYAEES